VPETPPLASCRYRRSKMRALVCACKAPPPRTAPGAASRRAAAAANTPPTALLSLAPAPRSPRKTSDGSSVPHINAVKTCSSASIVSNSAKGISVAFGISHGASLVSAAGACGDAVADGMGSICRGLDAGTAIVGAAQICATALAAVYSRTLSGAASAPDLKAFLDPRELAGLAPTRQGYYQACTSSCNNAQSAAEALAQGAACGATAATQGCAAVTAEVQAANFARAFASVAADGWSKSCARGASAALSGSSTMAAAASASFASAITKVAVRACASCPTCRCSVLPDVPLVNAAGRWQHAVSTFASGNVGLGHALASASSALCANGTKLTAHAAAQGAVLAYAKMVGGALGSTKATALQLGASATACSGSSLQTELQVRWGAAGVVARPAGGAGARSCPQGPGAGSPAGGWPCTGGAPHRRTSGASCSSCWQTACRPTHTDAHAAPPA
jgi:hypothetical protein